MLDKVWILPLLMGSSFVLTLAFGKRLPKRGAEFGTFAVAICLILSCFASYQWITRSGEVAPAGENSEEIASSAKVTSGSGKTISAVIKSEGEAHTGEAHSGEAHSAEVQAGEAHSGEAESEHEALRAPIDKGTTWFTIGSTTVDIGIHVDGLAIAMLFVVSFVSLCVHVFSLEYLRGDIRFTHYFASLNLFTGAMLWMVQTSSSLGLLFGWELMGLCSFLLIGHWWEDKSKSDAALKAFFTTRTGDVGLLIGIITLFFAAGKTFDFAKINEMALNGHISKSVLTVAAICLFIGAIGKSAQFPLYTWLPDAMAGPTPASSLIHAATMVVAGVYLVARLYGVFWIGFSIQLGGINLGALIGSITLIVSALLAFVQTDLKKVLAYSTVSQLGYMIMGLSVGSWTGALFHLFTHAFFKALLFQAAGSIAHSGSHHSFEMSQMGGLRKFMPKTWATFGVGYLALAGVFPFSGFWSKDEILLGAYKNGYTFAFVAGLIGSFMTAAYMTRAYWKTFEAPNLLGAHPHGEDAVHDVSHAASALDSHDDHHTHDIHDAHETHEAHDEHEIHGSHDADQHGSHDGPHESNWLITGPLIALATMAGLVGFLQFEGIAILGLPKLGYFGHWTMNEVLEKTVGAAGFEHEFSWYFAGFVSLFGAAGLAVGFVYNKIFNGDLGLVKKNKFARAFHTLLINNYYLDHLWTGVVVGTVKGPLARAAYWFNQNVLDAIVNVVGITVAAFGRFIYKNIDQAGIDGAVNGSGKSAQAGGSLLRRTQTGHVQNYAALLFAAIGLIGVAIALFH